MRVLKASSRASPSSLRRLVGASRSQVEHATLLVLMGHGRGRAPRRNLSKTPADLRSAGRPLGGPPHFFPIPSRQCSWPRCPPRRPPPAGGLRAVAQVAESRSVSPPAHGGRHLRFVGNALHHGQRGATDTLAPRRAFKSKYKSEAPAEDQQVVRPAPHYFFDVGARLGAGGPTIRPTQRPSPSTTSGPRATRVTTPPPPRRLVGQEHGDDAARRHVLAARRASRQSTGLVCNRPPSLSSTQTAPRSSTARGPRA